MDTPRVLDTGIRSYFSMGTQVLVSDIHWNFEWIPKDTETSIFWYLLISVSIEIATDT